jgi:hypothetical protein
MGTGAEALRHSLPAMTFTTPPVEIRKTGRCYSVFAGVSCLGRSFKTRECAQSWADQNSRFLAYWAGSASASVENTPARELIA